MSNIKNNKISDSSKDLTKAILLAIALGLIIPTLVVFPGLGYALKPFLKNDYSPTRIKATFKRLQKQELISIKEEGDMVRIELSDKGKRRVVTYKIDELELKKGKWDGIWRIVIFDIPEHKKVAREFLRAKIKELGFYMLQKSVFVTPWRCKDEIDFIKNFYEIAINVNLIEAKKFDQEEFVKNYFGLS